jgi:hypothetical protein
MLFVVSIIIGMSFNVSALEPENTKISRVEYEGLLGRFSRITPIANLEKEKSVVKKVSVKTSLYSRSAVIKTTLISVDDPTFQNYDPVTGKGVIAEVIDQDGQPWGLKEFSVRPGVPTTTVPASAPDSAQLSYVGRVLPKVNSLEHHRIYLKAIVESTGTDPILHSYIHQWGCFAQNNWWCVTGYSRNKGIYSLLPGEIKESITSYPISNMPSGYLWQRYQFGRWWWQWFDAWQHVWWYRPFVYFESAEQAFPSFSRPFSWWNAIGEPIQEGNEYSMSFDITNPSGGSSIKMRVYQAFYTWWPNLHRYWSGWDRYELDIAPGATETTTLTRTFPAGRNNQLLGGYHYEYLYDTATPNPNDFLPVYKGDWPRAGHEANKFLYMWYIHPRTTLDEEGRPNVNIKYGVYNLKYPHDYFQNVDPGDFEMAYYLYSYESRTWLAYDERIPLELGASLGPYQNVRLNYSIVLEPEDMKNWYYVQMRTIRKSDDRGIWYGYRWFKPQPILSSLDIENEVHLCPSIGVNRMYRRNQIYNINNFTVYSKVEPEIIGEPSAVLEYDEWVELPPEGLASTFLAYNYTGGTPGSTQRKDLKIKISYTDEAYREIAESKTLPVFIHQAGHAKCQGFKDIIPLEFNFGDLIMNVSSKVNITISNWGNENAGSFKAALYVDDLNGTPYSVQTISSGIDRFSEKTISFDFTPTNSTHSFKIVIDSDGEVAESSPNGANVGENNNYLIMSDIKVKRYDANTPYLNAFDLNNLSKRVDMFMASNGNTVDLIETATDSEGIGNVYNFPTVLEILTGPFNESSFDESGIDDVLNSALSSFAPIDTAPGAGQGGGGAIVLQSTHSHFPFKWNTSESPTSPYMITANASTDYDVNMSNNVRTKETEVCNLELDLVMDPFSPSYNISKKNQTFTILWTLTNNGINTNITSISSVCPANWACTIDQITPMNLLTSETLYIVETVNLSACLNQSSYTVGLNITYDDLYGLNCINGSETVFSKAIDTRITKKCLCEAVEPGEQEDCGHGEAGCWADIAKECCGDQADETWDYSTNKKISDVLVSETCYKGKWHNKEMADVTLYKLDI